MKYNLEQLISLRQRFSSDYNLPIQVFHSPYFEERLKISDKEYGSVEKYNNLIKLIDNSYKGNPSLFLEEYYNTRENIINKISETDEFIKFNNSKDIINDFNTTNISYPKKDIYTEDMEGKTLLSIDLRKANFQALKYVDKNIVFNTQSYEELIELFTSLSYVKESKYTRQVIFGKLNPKKTIQVEKYIVNKIYDYVLDNGYIGSLDGELVNISSDELIYNIDLNGYNAKEICNDIESNIKENLLFDVKVEIFNIKPIKFTLPFYNSTLTIFKKINIEDNSFKLKKVPNIYYPQIVKILNNEEIKDNDLIFFAENQLVKFLEPIKLQN